eukprot:gene31296-38667_t
MSAALAAMLKKRSDSGLVVITESNAAQVEAHVSPKRPSVAPVVQTTIPKVMLWGRKNKQGSEDGAAPELPAYVLASKKAAEEVSSRIGAMNDFDEPAIYGKEKAVPGFAGRALPSVPPPAPMQKRPSFMPVVNANKCGACDKTVYKMEEIIAIGK